VNREKTTEQKEKTPATVRPTAFSIRVGSRPTRLGRTGRRGALRRRNADDLFEIASEIARDFARSTCRRTPHRDIAPSTDTTRIVKVRLGWLSSRACSKDAKHFYRYRNRTENVSCTCQCCYIASRSVTLDGLLIDNN